MRRNLRIAGQLVEIPDGISEHTTPAGDRMQITRISDNRFDVKIYKKHGSLTSSASSPIMPGIASATIEGLRVELE